MSMTPEERAVIKHALSWHRAHPDNREHILTRLARSTQALKISRQPLHTVEPIPCMVYANHSATMFCVLPAGHTDNDEQLAALKAEHPWWTRTDHRGYANGDPKNGLRFFHHSPYYETMETHERAACPRWPGCERHP